ncbi:MAG: hypothetical protein IJH59_01690 [Firmicutes bacterium]|nr:hypothetical protein [Bacillota bacterium]
MKKTVLPLLLALALLLAACGAADGGAEDSAGANSAGANSAGAISADDPVCAVELGSTMEQARSAEPELTDYERENWLACDKAIGGVWGKLLVCFEPGTANAVQWNAVTEEGGRELYDQLLAELGDCYGKPASDREEQGVSSDAGLCDTAETVWESGGCRIGLYYTEYTEAGQAQIRYERAYD